MGTSRGSDQSRLTLRVTLFAFKVKVRGGEASVRGQVLSRATYSQNKGRGASCVEYVVWIKVVWTVAFQRSSNLWLN